jgi:hypothetical protein
MSDGHNVVDWKVKVEVFACEARGEQTGGFCRGHLSRSVFVK